MAAPRVAVVLPVRFSFGTRAVQTTTREISEEGVFVRCLEPPSPGTQVGLRIYLPGMAQAAGFVGLVRDSSAGKESGFWADFVSADLQAHEKLVSVLQPQRTQQGSVAIGALYKRVQVPPAPPRSTPAVEAMIEGELGRDPAEKTRQAVAAREGAVARRASQGQLPALVPDPPGAAARSGSGAQSGQPPGDVTLAGDPVNRRAFPRYRARFAVRFSSVQEFVLEYAANISAGGVFVNTDHPPEMDSVITVVLELPGAGEPVSCKALVVHRVTPEQARQRGTDAGVGVQFIEADDGFRQRIDETLELILQQDQVGQGQGKA